MNTQDAHRRSLEGKERSGKELESKAMQNLKFPPLKFPTCLCGTERCRELRKKYKEQGDPLKRYMSYGISFASGQKTTPKAKLKKAAKGKTSTEKKLPTETDASLSSGKKGKGKGAKTSSTNRKTKTDKKRGIYEKFLHRDIEHDTDYHIAALHFPVELLTYCSVKDKKPTFAFKQTDRQEMTEAGLREYLTKEFQCEDWLGKPIFFFPPNISVQAIDYREREKMALQGIRVRGRTGAPEVQRVQQVPHAAIGAGIPQVQAQRQSGVAQGLELVSHAAIDAGIPQVQAQHKSGVAQGQALQDTNQSVSVAAPPSVPAVSVYREEKSQEGGCAVTLENTASEKPKAKPFCPSPTPSLLDFASLFSNDGPDVLQPVRAKRFELTEPSQLESTNEFPKLGTFEETFQKWALEASNGATEKEKEDTMKSKQKYADDAMAELQRIQKLLDENPPATPDESLPDSFLYLPLAFQKQIEQSRKQRRKGQLEVHKDLIVPIANHIGNGYVDLYNRQNSLEDADFRFEGNGKRRRDPDNGDKHHEGRKDGSDSPSRNNDGAGDDHDNNGDRKRFKRDGSQNHAQHATQRDQVPPEIFCGAQSSLALCLSKVRRDSSFSDDSSIETAIGSLIEAGSFSEGYAAVSKSNPKELRGLHVLADACSKDFGWMKFYNDALYLDPPENLNPRAFNLNKSGVERGEINKQVLVLDSENQCTKLEKVFLLKAEDPKQAYKLLNGCRKISNVHGPSSGSIYDAVVLRRVQGNRFVSPRSEEAAEIVTIKQLCKEALEQYRGQECPYREISLLREVADDEHVHKLVEVLEDDKYLYIVTPFSKKGSLLDDVLNKRDKKTSYSEQEIKAIFKNILEILLFLEKHNLYHCALTPEYLEFHQDRLFLTRMGLALQISQEKHMGPFHVPLGPNDTLSFQPPEVHSNHVVMSSVSANLWSASVTLYFVLTGRTPFSKPHPADPGFKLFLSTRSLQGMVQFLKEKAEACARERGMQNVFAISNSDISPDALRFLSLLLKFKPKDRVSMKRAVEAAKPWLGTVPQHLALKHCAPL